MLQKVKIGGGMFDWLSKNLIRWLLIIFSIAISIFIIVRMPDDTISGHKYGILRDFALFVCSTILSLIVSFWFAKRESNEKIDTIAERSFEKMAMLTLQIERTKKFLVDTIKLSQSDAEKTSKDAGLLAYRHRINGTIATLDQIGTSNETFRSDWLGVVSPQMKKALAAKVDALAALPGLVSELSRTQSEPQESAELTASVERRIEEIEQAVTGAGRLIDEIKPKPKKLKVAQIIQRPSEHNNSRKQSGTVTISVERLTFRATGTAAFDPEMDSVPEVTVKLISYPTTANTENLRYPVGIGNNYDFNIGLHSTVTGLNLPLGDYVFEYDARA